MTNPRSLLVTDIEENFLHCSICLEIFTDPRLLPCHHRYCKECLIKITNTNINGDPKCPLCQQGYQIPENGVDGFKSDFHMNSLLQFINLQKSFEKKEIRECIGCSKQLEVTAYCFKCKDFLCDECFKSHLKSRPLRDHWRRVLSLKDFESQNLTAKDLTNLTEAPRCNKHLEQESVICCESCGNLPICMVCATPGIGVHSSHKVQDVTCLAETEKEKIKGQLLQLQRYKEGTLNLRDKVAGIRSNLTKTLTEQKSQLNSQFKKGEHKLTKLMTKNCDECKKYIAEVHCATQTKLEETKLERQQEIDKMLKQINAKYDEQEKLIRQTYALQTRTKILQRNRRESKLKEDMEVLRQKMLSLQRNTESEGAKNTEALDVVSEEIENTIKRLENVTSTANMILAANNDWMTVQCLPAIDRAYEPLIKELEKEYPSMDRLSQIRKHSLKSSSTEDDYTFHEDIPEVIPLSIKNIGKSKIDFVTVSEDGHIFIFYSDMGKDLKFIVLNKEGDMLPSVQNRRTLSPVIQRRSARMPVKSDSTVAVACIPSEIRIYEASNSSFRFRNLSAVIYSYPADRLVTWACINRATKEICVATNSRSLYIFDNKLLLSRFVTLPGEVEKPRHITMNRSTLFLCDSENDNAFVITISGYQGHVFCELSKPSAESGTDFTPLSIVIDKRETIYVLWGETSVGEIQVRACIGHYSKEGILLESRQAPSDAKSMAIQTRDEKELLVVVSPMHKLHLFELVQATV